MASSQFISLSEYLSRNTLASDYENRIYQRLVRIVDDNDDIVRDKSFQTPGYRVQVDFFLKRKNRKLDLPENTAIEFKLFLDASVMRRVYDSYKRIKELNRPKVNKFIIIYFETTYSSKPTLLEEDKNFEIINYEDFLKMTDPLLSADKEESGTAGSRTDSEKENADVRPDVRNWEEVRNQLLEELKRDFSKDWSTLFLGAGVSASAKMPGWGKLLESLLTKHSKEQAPDYFPCDLTNVLHSCGDSYIIAARYINFIIDESTRAGIIQETLYKNVKESELIKSICRLVKEFGVLQAITTNYDQLVEQGLKDIGVKAFSVTNNGLVPKDSFPVYHVHGSVNDPKNPLGDDIPDAPVLSEEDYHTLYSTGHHWSNTAILHALQHTHCVFIGLSMTDPNLRRLIETAHTKSVPHYVFLPRLSLYEGYYEEDPRNVHHFKVQENMMESLGIRIIWYKVDNSLENPHKELETLINSLITKKEKPEATAAPEKEADTPHRLSPH